VHYSVFEWLLVPVLTAGRRLGFAGFFFKLPVFSADEVPLADVSPAPLATAFPVAPGAMGSALVVPDDIGELGAAAT
jgi:hypothetical protein